jgi:hypothetical protein
MLGDASASQNLTHILAAAFIPPLGASQETSSTPIQPTSLFSEEKSFSPASNNPPMKIAIQDNTWPRVL